MCSSAAAVASQQPCQHMSPAESLGSACITSEPLLAARGPSSANSRTAADANLIYHLSCSASTDDLAVQLAVHQAYAHSLYHPSSQHVMRCIGVGLQNDTITISRHHANDHQVKLAICHALAQSTKLCVYEERALELVFETKHLPQALAIHGTVHVTSQVRCIQLLLDMQPPEAYIQLCSL
eukprot:GHUV01041541.1.p1 GENE.GHUV01041541.1~~GHUV01041541.1.p1  ORF type:complete len:181 (-),score=42.60 GHUV01041541.1:19-561(-)